MKYKTIIAAVLMLAAVTFGVARPALAVKCPPHSERNPGDTEAEIFGINSVAQCNLPVEQKGEGLLDRVSAVINIVLGLVGIIAVVVIIVGGISFITSQGDPGKVMKARNTILYGVVGIVVALSAFLIVNFVLDSLFSSKTTPTPSSSSSSSSQEN